MGLLPPSLFPDKYFGISEEDTRAVFPLPFIPDQDFRVGGVSFGNDRGDVLHAACDLLSPPGIEIYAVEKGEVLPIYKAAVHQFFESGRHKKVGKDWVCDEPYDPKDLKNKPGCLMVYELRIKHRNFIARYGEIAPNLPKGIVPGVTVEPGQMIAYVGAQNVATMLHFEMYSDVNDTDDLTKMGNTIYVNPIIPRATAARTYHRRKDLMDPTRYLVGLAEDFRRRQAESERLAREALKDFQGIGRPLRPPPTRWTDL